MERDHAFLLLGASFGLQIALVLELIVYDLVSKIMSRRKHR